MQLGTKDTRQRDDIEEDTSSLENLSEEEPVRLARREDRVVKCLRSTVAFLLFGAATASCVTIYFRGIAAEQKDFEEDLEDLATRLVESFELTLQQRIKIIDEFAQDLTGHAISSNSTWPNVTLPDYERRAASTSKIADVLDITLAPILRGEEQRVQFEQYAFDNFAWFAESIAVQEGKTAEEVAPTLEPLRSMKGLSQTGETALSSGDGPFAPIWQSYPALRGANITLTDLKSSYFGLDQSINLVLENRHFVMPTSISFLDAPKDLRRHSVASFVQRLGRIYEDDPILTWFYPVFDTFVPSEGELVALLLPGIYWRTYFVDILPSNAKGLIIVLENSCGQQFTYRVDGKDAKHLGTEDLHDPRYDEMVKSSDLVAVLGRPTSSYQAEDSAVGADCQYGIRVYPSKELEDSYRSGEPESFTMYMALAFALTSIIFILYEYFIERRQQIVLQSAMQSGALVSSLYPEDVRKRIYEEQSAKEKKKRKLEKFQAHDEEDETIQKTGDQIARLHPNATVFFADIANFTKWSSSRQPTEVFDLLETVYASFDRIARRKHVFKIETIGDCYVATAGLPKEQPNHAIIMAQFAAIVMDKFHALLPDLAKRLGEDTSTLALRVGLHSGPVTAGVLRGEKSRFQIFGDTVNMAARMESTGKSRKIQVSPDTARLLCESGRESWIMKRDDIVVPKGKGKIETYWLVLQVADVTSSDGSTFSEAWGSTTT